MSLSADVILFSLKSYTNFIQEMIDHIQYLINSFYPADPSLPLIYIL
jgi:hypothetical protein